MFNPFQPTSLARFILPAVAAIALSGCYALTFKTDIQDPDRVQMTPFKNGRVAKHFSEGKLVWYVLGGLIPIGDASLTPLLAPHLTENRRVANLKIHSQTWFDVWIVSLTAITVEGDIVIPR